MKIINIETSQTEYPLVIGSNIFHLLPRFIDQAGIKKGNKILIITDENVAPFYHDKVKDALTEYHVFSFVVQAGESSKSLKTAEKIITYAIEQGFDRTSAVVALGGGVVGDLAGFVSVVYMRGIAFIQCPTTILAHDSSVGGKVAVNHPLGKNLIGAFYQPKLVFYDTSFLKTLPKREIKSGLAEVIKHGLIADSEFVNWLDNHADLLLSLDLEDVNYALFKGISIKGKIVKEDEKEQGIRAILNYGHTLGHAVEIISDFNISHGEGVAIGMVYAVKLARKLGLVTKENENNTVKLISKYQLPVTIPDTFNSEKLMELMQRDKKFKNNQIRMILPVEIGKVIIEEDINPAILKETIEQMK